MSLFPKLFPNIRPIIARVKEKAKSNLLTNTNTVIGIFVGISTLIVYGFDITEKLYNTETEGEKKDKIELVEKNTEAETPKKTVNKKSNTQKQSNNRKTVSLKGETYFNNKEILLENKSLALFIKDSKNTIYDEFQNKLSNAFQQKKYYVSTSLFNTTSLPYYNNFYSANPSWLETTKIKNHINIYLIGGIKINKTKSSADSDISIVNLVFQGKLVDTKSNHSIPIEKSTSASNYKEFKAFEDAYSQLCKAIVDTTQF